MNCVDSTKHRVVPVFQLHSFECTHFLAFATKTTPPVLNCLFILYILHRSSFSYYLFWVLNKLISFHLKTLLPSPLQTLHNTESG